MSAECVEVVTNDKGSRPRRWLSVPTGCGRHPHRQVPRLHVRHGHQPQPTNLHRGGRPGLHLSMGSQILAAASQEILRRALQRPPRRRGAHRKTRTGNPRTTRHSGHPLEGTEYPRQPTHRLCCRRAGSRQPTRRFCPDRQRRSERQGQQRSINPARTVRQRRRRLRSTVLRNPTQSTTESSGCRARAATRARGTIWCCGNRKWIITHIRQNGSCPNVW